MIRKARNDYVCECCGHIIKAGSEYLDKVILNNGKCVQHSRYHDECPKLFSQEVLFSKIVKAGGDLIAANEDGTKIHIIGIAYKSAGDPVILYMDWGNATKKAMGWTQVIYYHDADGNLLV